MILKLYPENPNPRTLATLVETLRAGGLVIYPTDTVYAIGCSLGSPRAIERLRALKGKKESDMAIVCRDLSEVAEYARVDNLTYKLLRRNLPGPFTFILPAASRMSDKAMVGRKTVGVRIPANLIALAMIEALGVPMVTTSLKGDAQDMDSEYFTDPELIHEQYQTLVDVVVDGGVGDDHASTVVDCTSDEPVILRQGLQELEF